MGAQCASPCREDSIKMVGDEKGGQSKDTKFWQEKMRFSSASQKLFNAAVKGDATLAGAAVRGLGDPNCCSAAGYRPLQVAISCGNQELVSLLLKAGADINGHSKDTPPPLVLAAGNAEDRDGSMFEVLLGQGADLNVAEEISGETALTRAADRGHYAIVHAILSRGSSGFQKLVAQRARTGLQGDGATALHLAAARGHRMICDKLLGVGADPSAADRKGRLPLHRATEGNHVEVSNLLLTFGSAHSAQDKEGASPLHLAADQGSLTMADLLVRFSADVNSRRKDGLTALHLAARGGHDVLCQLFTGHGAEPNAADANGVTPFALAFGAAHTRCCRVLLGAGAEVKALESHRWSPPYTEFEGPGPKGKRGTQGDESPRELVGC